MECIPAGYRRVYYTWIPWWQSLPGQSMHSTIQGVLNWVAFKHFDLHCSNLMLTGPLRHSPLPPIEKNYVGMARMIMWHCKMAWSQLTWYVIPRFSFSSSSPSSSCSSEFSEHMEIHGIMIKYCEHVTYESLQLFTPDPHILYFQGWIQNFSFARGRG